MKLKKPLKVMAYETLKDKILSNEFKPNSYLEEKTLCEMLNISRTPIREAINILEYEDLVQVIPQKGIFVTDISFQFIAELFQARKLMEPLVLRLSANRLEKAILTDYRDTTLVLMGKSDIMGLHKLDYEFHNYIHTNCGNQHLVKLMSRISDQFQRIRTQDFYPQQRAVNGAKEHIDIIDKIINEEYDGLSDLMRAHIASTESYYFKSVLSDQYEF